MTGLSIVPEVLEEAGLYISPPQHWGGNLVDVWAQQLRVGSRAVPHLLSHVVTMRFDGQYYSLEYTWYCT